MSASKSHPSHIADHIAALPKSGIRDFFEIVSTMQDVISLGIGEPDFDAPWHVREATVFGLEKGATHYTSNLGLAKLRNRIVRYLHDTYELSYDANSETIITVGVSEALDLAIRAIINPGEEVLYHEPCYVSYAPLIRMAHGVPRAVATKADNGFRLTAEALEEQLTDKTRVLLLNYPNNPTGATILENDLKDIVKLVIKHDLVVISDDIYAELTYDIKHRPVAGMPGMRERTIFLHGFSKAWAMTGFRLGYACGPAAYIDAMMKIHQYTMLCAPSLSQEAAIEALNRADEDVQEMKAEYRRRRNYIYRSLTDIGLECNKPGGAFYIFPSIEKTGLSSQEFAFGLLEDQKVAVVPGTAFGACGEGFIRCSYATSLEDLEVAVKRIEQFIGKHVEPQSVSTHSPHV